MAVDLLTQAIQIEAKIGRLGPLTLAKRSESLTKTRRAKAALADADAALLMNPQSARALRARGRALRHMGRYREASQALAKANKAEFSEEVKGEIKVIQVSARSEGERSDTSSEFSRRGDFTPRR